MSDYINFSLNCQQEHAACQIDFADGSQLKLQYPDADEEVACEPVEGGYQCADVFLNASSEDPLTLDFSTGKKPGLLIVRKNDAAASINIFLPIEDFSDKSAVEASSSDMADSDAQGVHPRYKKALATVAKIKSDDERDEAYLNIVRRVFVRGHHGEALKILAKVTSDEKRDYVYADIAKEMIKAGHYDNGIETLANINDDYVRDDGYLYAAETMASASDGYYEKWRATVDKIKDEIIREKALAAFRDQKALETAAKVTSDENQSNSYWHTVIQMMSDGDYEIALATVAKVKPDENQANLYWYVVSQMIENGHYELALATVANVKSDENQYNLYVYAVSQMIENGHYKKALEAANEITDKEIREKVLNVFLNLRLTDSI